MDALANKVDCVAMGEAKMEPKGQSQTGNRAPAPPPLEIYRSIVNPLKASDVNWLHFAIQV